MISTGLLQLQTMLWSLSLLTSTIWELTYCKRIKRFPLWQGRETWPMQELSHTLQRADHWVIFTMTKHLWLWHRPGTWKLPFLVIGHRLCIGLHSAMSWDWGGPVVHWLHWGHPSCAASCQELGWQLLAQRPRNPAQDFLIREWGLGVSVSF